MAPPRASRLQSRVSLVADPSLYLDTPESSSSSSPPHRRAAPPPTPALPPQLGVPETKRRSTRLSNESDGAPGRGGRNGNGNGNGGGPPAAAAPPGTAAGAKAKTKTKRPAPGKGFLWGEDQAEGDDREERSIGPGAGSRGKRAKVATAASSAGAGDTSVGAANKSGATKSVAVNGGGYAPRAAVGAGKAKKPPPTFSHKLATGPGDDDDDDDSLLFTKQPPTPGAPARAGPSNKRSPAKTRENPKAKVPRLDEPVPIASTSNPPPTPSANDKVRPLHTADTPVQVRNIAFRDAPASSARRTSVERRGSRGSVTRASRIGGFDAIPHPEVPDDKLFRSTIGDAPVAVRLRSVLTWTAMRQRGKVFPASGEAEADETTQLAKEIVDAFIADLGNGSLNRSPKAGRSHPLPPHPQNVVNSAKHLEIQDNYALIKAEQDIRNSVTEKYEVALERTPLPPPIDPTQLDFSLDLPIPTSLEEALSVGRTILDSKKAAAAASSKKGKGKEVVSESVAAAAAELADLGLQTSSFRLHTHRRTQFCAVASSYVDYRVARSHQALSLDAQRGSSRLAPGIAGVAQGLGGPGAGAEESLAGSGPDPRDLLRAIAAADLRSRTGGP